MEDDLEKTADIKTLNIDLIVHKTDQKPRDQKAADHKEHVHPVIAEECQPDIYIGEGVRAQLGGPGPAMGLEK